MERYVNNTYVHNNINKMLLGNKRLKNSMKRRKKEGERRGKERKSDINV